MDLLEALVNLADNLTPVAWELLTSVGLLAGFVYVSSIVFRCVKDSQMPGPPTVSNGSKIIAFFVAVFMANLLRFISRTNETMGLGSSSFEAISYASTEQFGELAQGIDAAFTLAAIFGGLFAFKGLLALKGAVENSGRGQYAGELLSRAAGHIFGGAMLVNLTTLFDMAQQSINFHW